MPLCACHTYPFERSESITDIFFSHDLRRQLNVVQRETNTPYKILLTFVFEPTTRRRVERGTTSSSSARNGMQIRSSHDTTVPKWRINLVKNWTKVYVVHVRITQTNKEFMHRT